jgi:flagellar assembly protein FliH
MPSIIRATDRESGTQTVAFNFDDMTAQANRYLDKVRGEATQIVRRAQEQATAARGQVRREAEVEGRQAAMQAVGQMVGQQMTTALPALNKVVEDIRHAKQAWLRHWEQSAVHVAAAIAGRVLRRELTRQPEVTLTLVREALELAAGSTQLRIHLHPDDHRTLAGQVDALAKEMSSVAEAELVADPEITRGGCRVETRFGVIDQQFEAQLARIEEELT